MPKSSSACRVPHRLKDHSKPGSKEGNKGTSFLNSITVKSKSSSSVSEEAGKAVNYGNASKGKAGSKTHEKDFNTRNGGGGRRACTCTSYCGTDTTDIQGADQDHCFLI